VALVALAGSGCATFKTMALPSEDIGQKQSQRTEETVQAFEEQRNQAQFMAAQARWREGNLKACRESLESLLARVPAHLEARLLLVQVLLSEEKFDVAKGYLEQILAERPADARAQHTMGVLLEAKGEQQAALACYKQAAELEPENQEFALCYRTLEQQSQASAASHQDADGPARSQDASRVRSASERPEVERAFDDAERQLIAGDIPAARDALARAVSFESDKPRLPIRAAVLALRHQQPQLAVFVLRPLADRFVDSAAFQRTLGTACYRAGDYPSAQSALEQALSLDKSSALAYLLMGCTLEKLGHLEAARTHLEQARRLDPRLRLQP
jgi:tetratricopeptide (TPR) repeat protein